MAVRSLSLDARESSASDRTDLLDDASRAVQFLYTMADELEGMETFVAVAEAKGFRPAAARLGVTGSAVSQAIRRLETRLGVSLVQRTTRSVRLTDAGERLYTAVRPALNDVRTAIAAVGELSAEPRGTLRILVSPTIGNFLRAELLAEFLRAHEQIALDLVFSDERIDIVAAGYDAGVRLGEVIDADMIAVPVSGDLRLRVVGAPSYFAKHPKPKHPRDLAQHACINWHATASTPAYRWEFNDRGRDFSVAVPSRILTTDPSFNIKLARAGLGITLANETRAHDDLENGTLISVLDEFSVPFPGFYLYYPQRRHASPALRAFVDFVRQSRRPHASRARGKAKR